MRIHTRIAVVAMLIMAIADSTTVFEPALTEFQTRAPLTLRGSPASAPIDDGARVSHPRISNSECIDALGCGSYEDDDVTAAPSSSLTQLHPASFAR
jgi:hypothetical protein